MATYTTIRNEKGQYIYLTKWKAFKYKVSVFFKKLFKVSLSLSVIALAFYAGQFSSSTTTYAQPIEKIVLADSPVLDRIAKCESPNGQLAKNGQVQVHANSNGTVDAGMYQINIQVWGAKATELGYDLFSKEGNKKMAEWLYANKGTSPWYSSAKCWDK